MGKGRSDHSAVCVATETAPGLVSIDLCFQEALTDPDPSDFLVLHDEAPALQLLLVHKHALVCAAVVPGVVAPCVLWQRSLLALATHTVSTLTLLPPLRT